MDRSILEKAAKKGIISNEQVELLLDFESCDENAESGNAEEQLRFVRSFGDIFITLGIIFVSIAIAQFEINSFYNVAPILLLVVTTEWLVRVRRLALPGIALLIATLYFSTRLFDPGSSDIGLLNLFVATTVACLFYWRYKMPFTLLPIAMGIIAISSSLIGVEITQAREFLIIYGLLVFATAMWFDARDVERKTRLSDTAFWLHLLAAPLIVHGVMISLLSVSSSLPYREILIIIFFVAFFLLALYVDRRALLVSSVSYAIYAIIQLARSNQINIENMTLLIFVGFGIFIVVFGVYWYKIRALIFSKISHAGMSMYVPPFNRK